MEFQSTQEDLVADADKKAAIQAYIDGLNSGDLEAVVALFAKDARIEDPVGSSQIVEGRDAIRAFYARSLSMDLKVTLSAPIRGSHGNQAAMAFEVEIRGAQPALLIRVIDVMHFNTDGSIRSMQAYWSPEDATPAQSD